MRRLALLCAGLGLLSGCATTGNDGADPWEGFNREVFALNEDLDRALFEPAAAVWDFLLPELLVTGIDNVYRTADRPFIMVHDLLQGEPRDAGEDLLRLIVNLTFGLGGLIDAASAIDIPDHREDWGLTLARWGIGSGPYLVLPLFGPSSVRDGFGRGMDAVSRPEGYFLPFWQTLLIRSGDLLDTRARYREEIAANRAEAFDFYVFTRTAYRENRTFRERDGRDPPDTDSDLYYFEDEEEYEEPEETERVSP